MILKERKKILKEKYFENVQDFNRYPCKQKIFLHIHFSDHSRQKKIIEIMGLNIFVFSLFSPFSFIFFPFPPYFPVPQRKPKKEKEKERLTEVFYNYVNVHVLCVLYLLQFGLNIVVVCLPAGLCEGR